MSNVEWSQPSLFLGPRPALRLLLEVLLDPQEETGVIAVEARTYPSRELVALKTSPPVPFADVERVARTFAVDFLTMLREHSGPFA